jgi:hypothetical protein
MINTGNWQWRTIEDENDLEGFDSGFTGAVAKLLQHNGQ